MRDSLRHLLDVAYDVQVYLAVMGFSVYNAIDYAYVSFRVPHLNDPRALLKLVGNLEVRIVTDGDDVVIKIYDEEIKLAK